MSFHRDRDILIHLYPSTLRFPHGQISLPERNCVNPANIFIIEYVAAGDPGQGVTYVFETFYQFKIRCRSARSCIEDPLLSGTGLMTFSELLQELKNERKDFNSWPVMLLSPSPLNKMFNLNQFLKKTLRTWHESPAGYNNLMFFFLGLVKHLNFTLFSLSGLSLRDTVCENGLINPSNYRRGPGEAPNFLFDGFYIKCPMSFKFIYGSRLLQSSPVLLPSIMAPFPIHLWLLLTVLVGAIVTYLFVQLRSMHLLAIASLLVAQYCTISFKTSGPKLLHVGWMLGAICLSNVYLGRLRGLTISPDVSIADKTLHELLVRHNFTLQALHTSYDGLMDRLKRDSPDVPKSLRHYHKLAIDHLKPANFARMSSAQRIQFLQLESHALFDHNHAVGAYSQALPSLLHQEYYTSKETFLETWSGIVLDIPSGGAAVEKFKKLIDGGTLSFCNLTCFKANSDTAAKRISNGIRRDLKSAGVVLESGHNEGGQLQDPLILEALWALAAGLGLSIMVAVVEITSSGLEFYFY